MTFDSFIDKWLGKKADYDGKYDGQCVDLYRFYVKEVLEFVQSPGVDGAYKIWDTADKNLYEFITSGVPKKGDIVIWNKKAGGGFGHVAIFIEGDSKGFTSFDQNWPTLSKCTRTKHDYTNVIGWMRAKGNTMADMYKGFDLTNKESMKVAVDILVRVQAGEFVDKPVYEADLKKKDELIENLNQQINDRNNDIAQLNAKLTTAEKATVEAQTRADSFEAQALKVPGLIEERDHLLDDKKNWAESEATYNRTIAGLKAENQKLRDNSFKALITNLLDKLNELVKKVKGGAK